MNSPPFGTAPMIPEENSGSGIGPHETGVAQLSRSKVMIVQRNDRKKDACWLIGDWWMRYPENTRFCPEKDATVIRPASTFDV